MLLDRSWGLWEWPNANPQGTRRFSERSWVASGGRKSGNPAPTAAVVVRGAANPYLLAEQVDERIEVLNQVCEKVYGWILNTPVAALGTAD